MIWRLLIVYTLVPAGCKRQIAQSIAAGIGHFFGDFAAEHAVQLVAGVDTFFNHLESSNEGRKPF